MKNNQKMKSSIIRKIELKNKVEKLNIKKALNLLWVLFHFHHRLHIQKYH